MSGTGDRERLEVRGATVGAAAGDLTYGPDGPGERTLRLLGDVGGKRVLDLGCGDGRAAVALAARGASVTAVDASVTMLSEARRLAERAEVRVEWRHDDLADLAFLRADSVDVVLSVQALDEVRDLGRVFRQAHRVLKPYGTLVFSHAHPFALATARDAPAPPAGAAPAAATGAALPLGRLVVRRSAFDRSPSTVERGDRTVEVFPRSISDVFADLVRAGFRVEVLLEPEPAGSADPNPLVPSTVVWRARKEGA